MSSAFALQPGSSERPPQRHLFLVPSLPAPRELSPVEQQYLATYREFVDTALAGSGVSAQELADRPSYDHRLELDIPHPDIDPPPVQGLASSHWLVHTPGDGAPKSYLSGQLPEGREAAIGGLLCDFGGFTFSLREREIKNSSEEAVL